MMFEKQHVSNHRMCCVEEKKEESDGNEEGVKGKKEEEDLGKKKEENPHFLETEAGSKSGVPERLQPTSWMTFQAQ